jgi:hypothetical protein
MISGFERGVNEVCAFWDCTQRRLVVYCWRFGTKVGSGEILTTVLVKVEAICDILLGQLVNLPSSSGPTVQDEGTTFNWNICNPSPIDRAWSSTPVWEHNVSQNRRSCQAELLCMTHLLRICEVHCRIHKSPILDIFFIPFIIIYENSG